MMQSVSLYYTKNLMICHSKTEIAALFLTGGCGTLPMENETPKEEKTMKQSWKTILRQAVETNLEALLSVEEQEPFYPFYLDYLCGVLRGEGRGLHD